MEELGDHGAERTAGHDDGAFRSEWSAAADGDGRGERLENRQARLDAAAVDENRFDSFRNSVAADALGAIARHESNDESAGDGDENGPCSQVISRWGHQLEIPALVVEEIGEQSDEAEQGPGN